ncbi:trypsin-like serine protease [Hansschlegelia sp.]|uniref:trypsin-like serine protease n=1 Tax=Hansschlegelia sp. TaxID=2041892 RepID=UPI002B68C976|nr:trypsin-like serine protease [Hansschlegelia sp.]HVI27750.1 trypsin-like serine protease [Hansschlegelia sp.]
MRPLLLLAAALAFAAQPVHAQDPAGATVAVQAVAPAPDGRAQVTECSGVLIAPDLVLTAGHCLDLISAPAQVAAFAYQGERPIPRPLAVAAFARHPDHVVGWRARPGGPETRQSEIAADLALLRLAAPLAGAAPARLGPPPQAGAPEGTLAGTGAAAPGGRSGLKKRLALSAIRLSTGTGARIAFATSRGTVCGGDSGGPVAAPAADGAHVWAVAVAVLRPASGCGGRFAAALVDPASADFVRMRSAVSAP